MSMDQKHGENGKSADSITSNSNGLKRRDLLLSGSSLVAASALLGAGVTTAAQAQQPAPALNGGKQPNIVVIWGDDIGISDVSAYTQGLMGFRTPNIDRIAREGMMFTDIYAEQSCTAGRASFITGQSGLRTGLTKVGLPGATLGLQKEDPTIAELLKPLGYATGQFGKNHLGDRNEFLPTVHGFDEFYGNLYHLNAEEEPQLPDYPKDPAFRAKYGPRGVLDCKASDRDDPTIDPRFGKVGKQVITDTGPLTKERMITIDDDIANRSVDFIQRQHKAGKPFFVWVNFTHMHLRTHTKPQSIGQSGRWESPYHDTMIDHDKNVGEVLKALDDLGIADNTFVMYSTDNGPHMNSWPDGDDAFPQREEHKLGRSLPGAGHVSVAGQNQTGPGVQRDRRPPRHAADHPRDRRRHAGQGQVACRLQGR
jgi:arylsulfatase